MNLHTLFVSHNREAMTLTNVERYKVARAHALENIDTLDRCDCTIWVTTQGEKDFFDDKFSKDSYISTTMIGEYIGRAPLLMSEYVQTTKSDLFHITWDDHGLYEDCYTLAINAMLERFPKKSVHNKQTFSYDGVVGINIANYPKHWPWRGWHGSQHLIGAGIVESFKKWSGGKPFFCPDFKRVMWECEFSAFLRFYNAIWYCPEAKLDHWRPDAHGNIPDKSHIEGRSDGSMRRDAQMHQERRKRGYYWGLNFKLVGDLDSALRTRGEPTDLSKIINTRDMAFAIDTNKESV